MIDRHRSRPESDSAGHLDNGVSDSDIRVVLGDINAGEQVMSADEPDSAVEEEDGACAALAVCA